MVFWFIIVPEMVVILAFLSLKSIMSIHLLFTSKYIKTQFII